MLNAATMTIVAIITGDQILKNCYHLFEANSKLTDPIDHRDIKLALILVRRVDHVQAETISVGEGQNKGDMHVRR